MSVNLAAITDINRIVHQINQGNYDIAPDQFYDRVLLDTIKLGQEHYVHLANTENYTLPAGTKKLQKRRWGGLTAHTTPLKEGLPPAPDKTSMESITFTATAFGRYMEFTDRVNLDQIDPQIVHYTKELGDVMARTLERYARETLLSSASKLFAGNKTSIGELTITDKLTIADLRFAALRMQRLLVKPLSSGFFNYICSPEFLYDLIDDPLVEKYMNINQTTRQLFDDGKPFPMFMINFIPTMLDEFYTPELDHPGEYFDGDDYILRLFAVDADGNVFYYNLNEATGTYRTTNTTVTYLHDGTAIEAGQKVSWAKPAFVDTNKITKVAASDGAVTEVTLGEASSPTTTQANALVWRELPVHKGILYGKDALVKIGIAGEQNAKTYIQALGSAGTNDPLHQRQTIGAKINSIGYGILRDEAVVVTYSVPSQAPAVSGLTAEVTKVANTVANKAADTAANELDYRDYTVDKTKLTDGDAIDQALSGDEVPDYSAE